MTLDEAWADAEAALPDNWELDLRVTVDEDGRRDGRYLASATYRYSLRHYRENVGKARYTPFEHGYADTPAAALHALATALRER